MKQKDEINEVEIKTELNKMIEAAAWEEEGDKIVTKQN